jgi:type IV pilus assembly protein PilM
MQVLSGRSDLPAGSPSRAAVQRAAAQFAARLQLEITRSAINHRRQAGGAPATALYLTGGGSLIAELPAVLGEKLKLRVERYEPLRHVELSANARAAGAESAAPVLADLVGLATHLVTKAEPDASLLPPALTEAVAFRKRQPMMIAAAALFVAALLPPIIYFHRVATVTLAQIEGQLMPLRALQTRNTDNLAKIDEAKKQIAALQGAVATKSNWINFFTDLQTRLVKIEDVWLDTLQIVRPPPPEAAAVDPAAPPLADGGTAVTPLKLTLSGRLLDVANPQSKVSPEARDRVKQLLASFGGSQFIASVENEKFDNSQNGLLHFDFTLVINPKNPL